MHTQAPLAVVAVISYDTTFNIAHLLKSGSSLFVELITSGELLTFSQIFINKD